ncbi:MAG: hypothetical protein H6538_08460 [Bacteroidales bacterium]|nr:hypothetical protein [Bacteroidales bacterium]MCB8998460.1 hypothetical protein [Bacteroidales bacterium]MCB9012903.1 hypothetical protein [Bacteroidales bacterium]
MKKLISSFLLSILSIIMIFVGRECYGQEGELKKDRLEFMLSLGPGLSLAAAGPNTSLGGGFAGVSEITLVKNRCQASVYANAITGGGSDYTGLLTNHMHDNYAEFGIKIGLVQSDKENSRYYFNTGICLLKSRQVYPDPGGWFGNGSYTDLPDSWGIPLEFGWLRHKKHFGYGFSFFSNLNTEAIFGGLALKASFGRFNYHVVEK